MLEELLGKFGRSVGIFNKAARIYEDDLAVNPSEIGMEARVVIGDVG
jgi:hypothetical protein